MSLSVFVVFLFCVFFGGGRVCCFFPMTPKPNTTTKITTQKTRTINTTTRQQDKHQTHINQTQQQKHNKPSTHRRSTSTKTHKAKQQKKQTQHTTEHTHKEHQPTTQQQKQKHTRTDIFIVLHCLQLVAPIFTELRHRQRHIDMHVCY